MTNGWTGPPTVLMARHGQTEWNVVGRRQGQLDSPLTAQGRKDAERIAVLAEAERPTAILVSPLGRARQTAAVVAAALREVPVVVIDDLAEMHHGDLAGLTNAEIDERYPGALEERARKKFTWTFPGGESYADLDHRAARALRSVQDYAPVTPLLVCHAMIARMLVRNLLDLTPSDALGFEMPHGAVLAATPSAAQPTRWLSGS